MAVAVSEFPFGTLASKLTLRKRNKLIVAFARGVLLSQTSSDGGAMNAYRFASEQHKPIATFAGDGTNRTSGNEQIARGEESKPKRGTARQQQLEQADANRATVFRTTSPDPRAWDEWLQQSFST
jgi:predicted Rossmann fold nucleotide-binding protein DprA/Smf involved in DNA uptake